MTIALYEDFADPLGQFHNYTSYDPTQVAALAAQEHVDLRSFVQTAITAPYTMYALDILSMTMLDAFTMTELENNALVTGENWSAGTVGLQSDRNHFAGISLTCPTGTTTTASVMAAIDISQLTGSGDYLSITLPALSSHVTLASSFIDLTSNASGNFTTGPTASLAFSSGTVHATGADTEIRFLLSSITTINKRAITGVRFRITTNASATFRCLAIRAMAASWAYAPVDQNTLYKRLTATVPPSGSLSQSYTFPVFPLAVFTDGGLGPAPVSSDIGAVIHVGSNAAANSLELIFREFPMTPYTMTMLEALKIGEIEAIGYQPDYIPGTLDDPATTRYIAVTLSWGTTSALSVTDQTGSGGYDFTPSLSSGDYYFRVTLADNAIRARIYALDAPGVIDTSTISFDTTLIDDPVLCPRRSGRIGWRAILGDGDAYVTNIRPRETVFEEYRSAPFITTTPTIGARIYPVSSPSINLVSSASPVGTATLTSDCRRSNSGNALRVQTTGNEVIEGLQSNVMRLENLAQSEVSFNIYAPDIPLGALLMGEGRIFALYMPPFPANHWSTIKIPLNTLDSAQPGPYALLIVQMIAQPQIWYIDNLSVLTRSVAWQGRQAPRLGETPWLDFGDALNDPYDAAVVGRDNRLQLRGLVLTQTGSIDSLKILPAYATLGNLVWNDEQPTYLSGPVAALITGVSGSTLTADASTSTAANGIAAYRWDFGDGSTDLGTSPSITHTYILPGTYTVTVTVIDDLDLQASAFGSVTV